MFHETYPYVSPFYLVFCKWPCNSYLTHNYWHFDCVHDRELQVQGNPPQFRSITKVCLPVCLSVLQQCAICWCFAGCHQIGVTFSPPRGMAGGRFKLPPTNSSRHLLMESATPRWTTATATMIIITWNLSATCINRAHRCTWWCGSWKFFF